MLALLLSTPSPTRAEGGVGAQEDAAPKTHGTSPASATGAPDTETREDSHGYDVAEWDSTHRPLRRLGSLVDIEHWTLRWKNGLWLERDDGMYRFQLATRVLLDGAAFYQERDLEQAPDNGWTADGEVRQARLTVQGVVWRRGLFKLEYEFAGNEGDFKDFFVGVTELGPLGTVKLGFSKEPFSLEQQTSRLFMTFMERSLANIFSPRRNTGLMATDTLLDRRLQWALGVFFVEDSFSEQDALSKGFDGDWDLTGRVTGLPLYLDDGNRLLALGLSYSHGFLTANGSGDQDGVRYSQRPESNLPDALLRTPTIATAGDSDRIGTEVAWLDGPLSAQGEMIYLHQRRRDGAGLNFFGGYAQVSYFPTGEPRPYSRRSGVFGRVDPRRAFRPAAREWGALQLATRLSYADLNDRDIRGGRQLDLTLGINWHLFANLRLMGNYVYGHVYGQGDINLFQARFQVEF